MLYNKRKLYEIETEGLDGSMIGRFIGVYEGRKVFSGTTKMKYENKVVERNVYIFLREHKDGLTDVEVITKKAFDSKANSRLNKLEERVNGIVKTWESE